MQDIFIDENTVTSKAFFESNPIDHRRQPVADFSDDTQRQRDLQAYYEKQAKANHEAQMKRQQAERQLELFKST